MRILKSKSSESYFIKIGFFSSSKKIDLYCDKPLCVYVTDKIGFENIKKGNTINTKNIMSQGTYIDYSQIYLNKTCYVVCYNKSDEDIIYNLEIFENLPKTTAITGFGF